MSDNPPGQLKRCAIYTRKSTNACLEQEINSLTTQAASKGPEAGRSAAVEAVHLHVQHASE